MSTGVAFAHPLDDPVASSLAGAHAEFAQHNGRITRYDPDVAGFIAYPADMEDADWQDLAELVGPGAEFSLRKLDAEPPPSLAVLRRLPVVQMTGESLVTQPDPALEQLGADDVDEILELIGRTRPGPFNRRTIEMGTYLGLRVDGRIAAMAGERLHPAGWTEISAVCVAPELRRQGVGARLVAGVGAIVRARGDVPFLHALATNYNAIDLYRKLGFRLREQLTVSQLRYTGSLPVLVHPT